MVKHVGQWLSVPSLMVNVLYQESVSVLPVHTAVEVDVLQVCTNLIG